MSLDRAIMTKVRKRARWIRRKQDFFRDFLPQSAPRRYVSGETHRYLGRQYRLKVVEAATAGVKMAGRFIVVHTLRRADTAQVRKLMEGWFLAHAHERFERSLNECAARLARRLKEKPRLQLRRMPKRWGSWTRRGGVWLNPELVKAPVSCIDYVVTHELCHAVHGHHGNRFFSLLRQVMPDWEIRKARLERVTSQ